MKIQNEQFGEINFEEDSVIKFEDGLLGFEELKEFLLISEEEGLFLWLTSIDEPEIIFPIFSINVLQEKFETAESYEPFGIVKLDKDPENVTINLKAPVFINQVEKKGYQKLIDNEANVVDYPLFANN
ncbi:MAG: flagellar assembly protein FliW [Ignavibacteriae bacterium]|nr:flagellar assembly protein FliW [Ignavibacteriota bacterium]